MATLTTSYPAKLYIGGKLIGTCEAPTFAPLPVAIDGDATLRTSLTMSGTIRFPKGQTRRMQEWLDPALKHLHHYLRVRHAQRRRQLQRKRQGRS